MSKSDQTMTLQELKAIAQKTADDRDWGQFHSPQNLSMYMSIEASELLEKFLYSTPDKSFDTVAQNRQEIEHEAADVLITLLLFCNVSKIDLTQAFLAKQEEIKAKYPIEKAKGKSTKYNKL